MGLDEQLVRMREFHHQLLEFNQYLHLAIRELEEQHDLVDPSWYDESRFEYNKAWIPFQEGIQYYLQRNSQQLADFLQQKIFYLDRYLHGG